MMSEDRKETLKKASFILGDGNQVKTEEKKKEKLTPRKRNKEGVKLKTSKKHTSCEILPALQEEILNKKCLSREKNKKNETL